MTERDQIGVNPGYALDQLERALKTAESHGDRSIRSRAEAKVDKWRRVLEGMFEGNLDIGSRVPTRDLPAWVTLEVVKGGFATGAAVAGRGLEADEITLAKKIGSDTASNPGRAPLNLYHLGDEGRRDLESMLKSGRFSLEVPEEGALLVLAWLVRNKKRASATNLLETLSPFFDRLRFFPRAAEKPVLPSSVVRLRAIGDVVEGLRKIRGRGHVECMNEAIRVWTPLYDRAVALFLETVEGQVPCFERDASGELARGLNDQPIPVGGWPCRHYPEGWSEQARTLLDDYSELRRIHRLSRKPERPKENFARLRRYLEIASHDPEALKGRDVGMIRKILASFVARRGAPGSESHEALRREQQAIAIRPTHTVIRWALIDRLARHPSDGGLDRIEDVTKPISVEETGTESAEVPPHFEIKIARCLEATIEELVERGVIRSGELLAEVLPQVTSQIRAAGLSDPELQRVYAAIYAAFRKRRSLLLLNLEHQVQIEELPWVSAIDKFRVEEMDDRASAQQAMEQVVSLAFISFPQTILPNPLLQELRAVATSAGLEVPLVDELAADIFMGDFSAKFLLAAKAAARMLRGSIYERYYDAPFDEILNLDDVTARAGYGARSSPGFAPICTRLAGVKKMSRWSVARNGMIIEQQQILTTQNLAVLFDALDLARALGGRLPELAESCFSWICRKQAMEYRDWRAQLQAAKNCAYAWRQMLFFLSLSSRSDGVAFRRSAWKHLRSGSEKVLARLEPGMRGLSHVASGGHFDNDGNSPGGGRRFLGWSADRHWILDR